MVIKNKIETFKPINHFIKKLRELNAFFEGVKDNIRTKLRRMNKILLKQNIDRILNIEWYLDKLACKILIMQYD